MQQLALAGFGSYWTLSIVRRCVEHSLEAWPERQLAVLAVPLRFSGDCRAGSDRFTFLVEWLAASPALPNFLYGCLSGRRNRWARACGARYLFVGD